MNYTKLSQRVESSTELSESTPTLTFKFWPPVFKNLILSMIFGVTLMTSNEVIAQHLAPMVINPTNPPGAPGPVTGLSSVLQGSINTYTVTAATGATNYTWSLSPAGAGTITGTTASANVHWGATFTGSVIVSCSAANPVGSTPGPSLTVLVTQPVTPLISGVISPSLQNNPTPVTLTSTSPSGGNGVYSYQWQSSLDNVAWTPISNAQASSYSPAGQTVSTYYRLVTTSGGDSNPALVSKAAKPVNETTFIGNTVSVVSNTAIVNTMVSKSYSPGNNIVTVNESTGTANVVIPLHSIAAAHVTFPINLIYSATGVKSTDIEQNAGMGWNVSIGGAVTRQLRGLPDDVSKDANDSAAMGWIIANNGTAIGNLSFVNDNNTGTCSDETTDLGVLSGSFLGNTDTEPDIFQVNAPGLSCRFFFDKNNVIRITPYQDLKVTYNTGFQGNADQGQITSFSITNDKGVRYDFGATSTVTQKATTSLGSVNYFQSNYNHFKNGITYYSSWGLTGISDVHNNNIIIGYTPIPAVDFSNPVQISAGGAAVTTLYTMAGSVTAQLPSSINCMNNLYNEGQAFQITYVKTPNSNKSCISNITGMGHDFVFGYNSVRSGGGFVRFFLNSVIDETCSAQTVNGQTVALSSYAPLNLTFNYLNTTNATTSLPSPGQNNIDYWGFTTATGGNTSLLPSIDINPSTAGYERYRNRQITPSPSSVYTYAISGANREPDQYCTVGTLSQINYSAGGYTALAYEPNQYYDNTLQTNVQGGGIRITQILDHDGINTDNDFRKTYTYRDLATGISSGKALSLPVFAFTTPYSGSNTGSALWTSSTMISPYDLSGDDHSVLYSAVTETVNNGGSTIYQYAVPASNWDTTIPANPNWSPTGLPAWSLTTVDVGRAQGSGGSCQTVGVLRNDVNTYPFPPNTNYDFERGLLTNVLAYDNNGTQVSETDYYYQTPEAPVDIMALKYDVNNYATNYAKYTIHTSAAPVVSQVVNKLFDISNVAPGAQPTTAQIITTNNAYNGALHKLSQQTVINSDGSKNTINIKYTKDYTITTAGDSYLTNLLALQNLNLNVPVETYTQFTPVNGVQAVTTGADLTFFGTFPNQGVDFATGNLPGMTVVEVPGPAPLQHRKFTSAGGVTNFSPSFVSGTNTFQFDNRYTVTENDLGYDYTGFLLSKDDGFQHIKTTIYDNFGSYRIRAVMTNARFDEIGLDYPLATAFGHLILYTKSPNAYNFSQSPGSPPGTIAISNVTRNGEQAMSMSAGIILMKSVKKNPAAKNYIFSIWVNSSVAGSITINATDGTNTVTKTLGFDATVSNPVYPSGFEYCRVAVPVTGLTASSTITVSFSSSQNINCTNILTYPDVADLALYSYDNNNNKIAETNGNGVSSYYSYDGLGRLTFVYDQDNNITERKTYVNNNPTVNSAPAVNLSWTSPAPGYVIDTEIIQFSAVITGVNTCTFNGNTVYKWDFGDGHTQTGTSLVSPANAYKGSRGQHFTCTLSITSPQNATAPFSVSSVVTL